MSIQSAGVKPLRTEPPRMTPASDEPVPPNGTPPRKPRRWLRVAVMCLICGAAYGAAPYYVPHVQSLFKSLTGGTPAAARPAARPVPVVTGAARLGDMNLYLNGLGSVTAFYSVTVRSRVDGELVKVLFQEGQMVHANDLIAEIDPRPFEAQLTQAKGQLIKDEAALWAADLDLKRYTVLRAKGAITQQDLDAQTALVKQDEGAIKVDQGQIANVELQLTYSHITAPISGRIGLRLVDPGNMVHATDTTGLAVITQLQPIALVFTIPQDDISRVQLPLRAGKELVVEAWDRGLKTRLAVGKLLALDNQVDQTTGTVRRKAVFENHDQMLFPNQFVNARMLVDARHDVVIAPAAAIQRGPDSFFVYVVTKDSTAELRKVTVGPSEGVETTVETGLSAGEIVVTDGVDKLQPGAQVITREPATPGRPGAEKPAGKPALERDTPPAREKP